MWFILRLLTKILWPILTILSFGVISRLWIGHVFRTEFKRHEEEFNRIQKGYNGLVWNERLPAGHERAYPTLPNLGQFCWDEMRKALKLCIYSFWKRKDRDAIRRFLEFEKAFKEQPNYFDLDVNTRANTYGEYIKKHLWCMNLMRNLGWLGTNNFDYDGASVSEALPFEYGITLDKSEAFNLYAKDNGIRILEVEDMSEILKKI